MKSSSIYDICHLHQQEDLPGPFLEYFDRQWLGCNHAWAQWHRINFATLITSTTNYPETYHKQVKRVGGGNIILSNCLKEVVEYNEKRSLLAHENAIKDMCTTLH